MNQVSTQDLLLSARFQASTMLAGADDAENIFLCEPLRTRRLCVRGYFQSIAAWGFPTRTV
jgi:hypothetical protein